jgi:hypothetical protein
LERAWNDTGILNLWDSSIIMEELKSKSRHRKRSQSPEAASEEVPEKSPNSTTEDSEEQSDEEGEVEDSEKDAPPLPDEAPPPLPDEAPPLPSEAPPPLPNEAPPDDGWDALWDANAGTFYFFNRFTKQYQWENPRVPQASASASGAPGTSSLSAPLPLEPPPKPAAVAGGYNPAIHGDYDPNADYARHESDDEAPPINPLNPTSQTEPSEQYAATGAFNRFTGKWQAAHLKPENFTDESKTARQMGVFFDVDAAANAHDGRSLKAERRDIAKRLTKKQLKEYKEKNRAKKELKRKQWLMD